METSGIIDEYCTCGCLKSEHNDTLAKGHGSCKKCDCPKFTWASFVREQI